MKPKLNILIAYPYLLPIYDKIAKWPPIKNGEWNIFLDSGAFTNYSTGKEKVTLPDYIHFLKNAKDIPIWKYINLDIIGDNEGSEANFEIMKSKGLNPVPVFQRHKASSGNRAAALIQALKENELVCLGGVAGKMNQKPVLKYIKSAAKIANNINGNLHLLGCGNLNILTSTRFYSADSSSCCRVGRFKEIYLYHNGLFYLYKSPYRQAKTKNKSKLRPLDRHVLRKYCLTEKEISSHSYWVARCQRDVGYIEGIVTEPSVVEKQSWIRFSRFMEKRGTKYFMALSGIQELKANAIAWEIERKNWGY